MTSKEIRDTFLQFFQKHDHHLFAGSSLIPEGDATLLFTNAGMVQFKDIFTGKVPRPVPTATTCQKCMRAGGKHNDLENVGYTARHHTFFEMLGNFSFGEYFKERAIELSWELLVNRFKLPQEQLTITIYLDDDEAFEIWNKHIGLPEGKILRLGEKDNFWAMGDTGPCGPCSEIIIDQGEQFSCSNPQCDPTCDCGRYLELWNLVFMQYFRSEQGKLSPLPKPSIDTGMGLERIAAVLQGTRSNYETDLFRPTITFLEELSGKKYQIEPFETKNNFSLRVIADHARACTFLINDGVLPANEGRDYVLRRIIRRAARHGKMLGIDKPFLYKTIDQVIKVMGGPYPDLEDRQQFIETIIQQEEERFIHTLERGMAVLNEVMEKAAGSGEKLISGEEIFRLYDTFGFPVDIAQDILKENNLSFDENGFQAAMENQRNMARQSWQGMGAETPAHTGLYEKLAKKLPTTTFLGYDSLESSAKVLAVLRNGERVKEASCGEEVDIILDQSPFYGEKGGQVGDQGILEHERISGSEGIPEHEGIRENIKKNISKYEEMREEHEGTRLTVLDTKSSHQFIIHHGKIEKGSLREGDTIQAKVDQSRRGDIAGNHTATHLLQAALRQILGDHIKQAGSLVAPDKLRFDFTHFTNVLPDELAKIEALMNKKIREDLEVSTKVMNLDEAVKIAVALFGEKYDQEVRVVQVADFSSELCGGTHTKRTGEIGLFKIINESSIAAGVRRIEALSGKSAFDYFQQLDHEVSSTAELLKTDVNNISKRVEQLTNTLRQKEKEILQLKNKLSATLSKDILKHRQEIMGVPLITHHLKEVELDQAGLRNMADILKNQLRSGIIVLGTTLNGKVNLVAVVTEDLTKKFHAGKIIKKIASIVGGSGGGRPNMAQAGGTKPENLPEALQEVQKIIKE